MDINTLWKIENSLGMEIQSNLNIFLLNPTCIAWSAWAERSAGGGEGAGGVLGAGHGGAGIAGHLAPRPREACWADARNRVVLRPHAASAVAAGGRHWQARVLQYEIFNMNAGICSYWIRFLPSNWKKQLRQQTYKSNQDHSI